MPKIESVHVVTPDGLSNSVVEAIAFIESFDESKPCEPFTRYEVGVHYTNGNEVRGQFNDKANAIAFLQNMR